MNSDEQFSDNEDKQMLNQQVNENVISFSHPRILKTPTVAILLGFFLFQKSDEQSDEQVMNNLFNLKTHYVKTQK